MGGSIVDETSNDSPAGVISVEILAESVISLDTIAEARWSAIVVGVSPHQTIGALR
jgi:hypothetical protein